MKKTYEALEALSAHTVRTPLIRSASLSELLECELYLKCEHLQVTGSIKARGAFLSVLSNPNARGFVAASSGNHGLGMATATKFINSKFKLFIPETTPEAKIEKIKSMDIDVVIQGRSWGEANIELVPENWTGC